MVMTIAWVPSLTSKLSYLTVSTASSLASLVVLPKLICQEMFDLLPCPTPNRFCPPDSFPTNKQKSISPLLQVIKLEVIILSFTYSVVSDEALSAAHYAMKLYNSGGYKHSYSLNYYNPEGEYRQSTINHMHTNSR